MSKRLKIGVLGSGSGSNMQSIQNAIEAGTLEAEIVCVVTDVASAGILERAEKHGLNYTYISPAPFKTKLDGAAEEAYIQYLCSHGAEFIVLAGFMRILKSGMLGKFHNRIINIHPALLPAFPGVAGWVQALEYGVKVSGCTVHFVDSGTDTGPVILQRTVPVFDDDTPERLHARIQIEEHIAYPEALRLIASGKLKIHGRRVSFNS